MQPENPAGLPPQGLPQDPALLGPPPGMPPELAGPPGLPPPGLPVGGPPIGPQGPPAPSEDEMLSMLLQAVTSKWSGDSAQLQGEKGMLIDTLMGIAQAQPPEPQDMYAEGAPGNLGMAPVSDPSQMIG